MFNQVFLNFFYKIVYGNNHLIVIYENKNKRL